MKLKSIFLLTAAALLITPSVQANYWGITLGTAAYNTSAFDAPFDHGLEASDTALGLVYGITSGDIFAIEFGYTDFSEASGTIYSESGTLPVAPFPTYEYSEQASIRASALQVAAVAIFHFGEVFALAPKIGFESWEAAGKYGFTASNSTGFENNGVFANLNDNGTDLFYGVGFVFSLSERIDLSLVYDIHDINNDLLDSIEIDQTGARLNFNL